VAGDRLPASPGGRGLTCRGQAKPEQQSSAPTTQPKDCVAEVGRTWRRRSIAGHSNIEPRAAAGGAPVARRVRHRAAKRSGDAGPPGAPGRRQELVLIVNGQSPRRLDTRAGSTDLPPSTASNPFHTATASPGVGVLVVAPVVVRVRHSSICRQSRNRLPRLPSEDTCNGSSRSRCSLANTRSRDLPSRFPDVSSATWETHRSQAVRRSNTTRPPCTTI